MMMNNELFPSSSGPQTTTTISTSSSPCPKSFSTTPASIQNGDIPTQQFVASSASALLNSIIVSPADMAKLRATNGGPMPSQQQQQLPRQCADPSADCFLFSNEEIFVEKPPKIIEGYLFGEVIGEGSYSKVKEVVHVRTLMRRAVKIIKDKRLRKIPGGEQNVLREIDVLRRLNHHNVVKVVDIFSLAAERPAEAEASIHVKTKMDEKQKLYIVMEFCVCSLQQMLDNCAEKMLPEFQAHLYFTQLIDGLDFLHTKRIIHKDIKPGNLLLSLDGILKICDLGVAELLASVDDWCTLVQGTPKFQPPEVVSGTQKRFRGRLVDIWSCGVTLYNLVSGCYPFDGDVIMKLFENITTAPLEMPPTPISEPLGHLLTGMLQKDPNKRWDTLRIRTCKWFTSAHQTDTAYIVRVPPVKQTPAHRPLSIYDALHQLYGGQQQTSTEEDGDDGQQQQGEEEEEHEQHREKKGAEEEEAEADDERQKLGERREEEEEQQQREDKAGRRRCCIVQ